MTHPDQPQLCVIGTSEHRAHDGTLVCSRHTQELSAMLRDVEDETALLDPRKSMSSHGGTRPSGLASEQSPVRLDALVLRDARHAARTRARPELRDPLEQRDPLAMDDTPDVLDTLGSWARMCREDWQLTWPDQVTVVSERRLLTAQLSRILEHEWVRDLHAELRDLLGALRRTNGTAPERALHGHCYRLTDAGTECGGNLWPASPIHSSGYETTTGVLAVQCGRDRTHRWEGVELARLSLVTAQQQDGAA